MDFDITSDSPSALARGQVEAAADKIAALETENARLRRINEIQKAALDRYAPCGGHAGKAPGGCLACAAERQLAEARRALGFFASVIMSGEPWTEVCEQRYRAALAPAEKPGSDGPDTDYDPSRDM